LRHPFHPPRVSRANRASPESCDMRWHRRNPFGGRRSCSPSYCTSRRATSSVRGRRSRMAGSFRRCQEILLRLLRWRLKRFRFDIPGISRDLRVVAAGRLHVLLASTEGRNSVITGLSCRQAWTSPRSRGTGTLLCECCRSCRFSRRPRSSRVRGRRRCCALPTTSTRRSRRRRH